MPFTVQFFQDQDAKNFVGSGFAIAPGWVLTCQHVLEGCGESIWLKPSDDLDAEEIKGDTVQIHMNNGKNDLDLVLVPCKSQLPAIAKLGIGLDPKFWMDDLKKLNCRVKGGLHREQRTITQGTQQATTREGLPIEVQVMGGIVEGYSGSPVVININGEEIAIGVAYQGGLGVNHTRIFMLDPVADFIRNHVSSYFSEVNIVVIDQSKIQQVRYEEIERLTNQEVVINTWKTWADEQCAWSPTFLEFECDDNVKSPLNKIWDSFLIEVQWHLAIKGRFDDIRSLLDQFEKKYSMKRFETDENTNSMDEYINSLDRIIWNGKYESIQTSALSSIQLLLSILNKSIRESEKKTTLIDESVLDLKDIRDKVYSLERDLKNPRFNRCFLVCASDGHGKTFFIDSIARRASELIDKNAILIRVRCWQDLGKSPEESIVHEIEKVFKVSGIQHLERINQSLSETGIRLIISIEDIQICLNRDSQFLEKLICLIKNSTSLHCILWLCTINDTSYDRIAAQRGFWTNYGYVFEEEKKNQLSGWIRLNDLNHQEKISFKILSNYLPEDQKTLLLDREVRDFVKRHLSSPLLALIAIAMNKSQSKQTLLGCNFISLIHQYWNYRMSNPDSSGCSNDEIKEAILNLSRIAAELGRFEIPKTTVSNKIKNPSILDCLHKMSLVRYSEISHLQNSQFTDPEELIYLLVELFWENHLAYYIESKYAKANGIPKNRINDTLKLVKGIKSLDSRESVAQLVLLLSDLRAESKPSHKASADLIWENFFDNTQAPPAASIFAASKSNRQRQELIIRKIKSNNLATNRQVFAVLQLLLESDHFSLLYCLEKLRVFTTKGAGAFQSIADANLGDLFLLLLERRLNELNTIDDFSKCWSLLANSHIIDDFAIQSSDTIWKYFNTQMNGKTDAIISAFNEYFLMDNKTVHDESQTILHSYQSNSAPIFFREHLIRSAFQHLLEKNGLNTFKLLEDNNWFRLNHQIDNKIVLQIRKQWSVVFGNWYRRKSTSELRGSFLELLTGMFASGIEDRCKLAYFMLRHSGTIDTDRKSYVDHEFYDIVTASSCVPDQVRPRFPILPKY